MGMDLLSGIVLPKKLLIQRLQERMPGAVEAMGDALQARLTTRGIERPPLPATLAIAHFLHA